MAITPCPKCGAFTNIGGWLSDDHWVECPRCQHIWRIQIPTERPDTGGAA